MPDDAQMTRAATSVRIVLDTNVVLDLVVFDDPDTRPLRMAIENGRVRLVTDAKCLAELARVLAYSEFALDERAQAAAFDWFSARAETSDPTVTAGVPLPRCRDADDQKFLDLAWAAQADFLVTKDKALLDLARRIAKLGRFSVSLPTELQLPAV